MSKVPVGFAKVQIVLPPERRTRPQDSKTPKDQDDKK